MKISLSSRTPVARTDELDFVVPLLVDLMAPGPFAEPGPAQDEDDQQFFMAAEAATEYNPGDASRSLESLGRGTHLEGDDDDLDDEPEFVVGRVWAERLDWSYAEECGFEVQQVCDARSGTWMQVLETISRNEGRVFRQDLNLTNFVSDVVFVHEVLLHPDLKDRVALLDAAIRVMSGDNSLILMYHEQSEMRHLEDWECNELGFKKIARSNLLIRDNHYRYPFSEQNSAGREVSMQATVEHENWVLERWEELIADHPSL
ncbi:MAG: hypothetical protein ACE361_25805 [Aureliella sp.]